MPVRNIGPSRSVASPKSVAPTTTTAGVALAVRGRVDRVRPAGGRRGDSVPSSARGEALRSACLSLGQTTPDRRAEAARALIEMARTKPAVSAARGIVAELRRRRDRGELG